MLAARVAVAQRAESSGQALPGGQAALSSPVDGQVGGPDLPYSSGGASRCATYVGTKMRNCLWLCATDRDRSSVRGVLWLSPVLVQQYRYSSTARQHARALCSVCI